MGSTCRVAARLLEERRRGFAFEGEPVPLSNMSLNLLVGGRGSPGCGSTGDRLSRTTQRAEWCLSAFTQVVPPLRNESPQLVTDGKTSQPIRFSLDQLKLPERELHASVPDIFGIALAIAQNRAYAVLMNGYSS